MTADEAVHTTYVADGINTVSMLNTSTCNAHHAAGCGATSPSVTVGTYPSAIAVDPLTHTVYVADYGAVATGTISVFDDRACNTTEQTGCGTVSTLNVPDGNPVGIAVNPQTDTLYVATITASGTEPDLGVQRRHLQRVEHEWLRADPSQHLNRPVDLVRSVAVNPGTNTLYITANSEGPDNIGQTVYMIDGTTCDAQNTTGCGNPPQSILIASDPRFGDPTPYGLAVDQRTDTIYAADIYDGEGAGTVAVINGATCNSRNKTGCDQTPVLAPAGFGTAEVAVDPSNNRVYATNVEDTSVTTVNGNSCNGTTHTGCANTVTQPIVGDYPGSISVDPAAGTAYVADIEGVSVVPLSP